MHDLAIDDSDEETGEQVVTTMEDNHFRVPFWYYVISINTVCQSITQHFILYTIKIVYCLGSVFTEGLKMT
jgi:hypothetical protein